VIEQILPASVATAESFQHNSIEMPSAAEGVVMKSGTFSAVHACVQEALRRPVLPPFSSPSGLSAAPRWPAGMIGSITHCAGYRGAAAALRADALLLGIDAEPNEALSDNGMLGLIACGEERQQLEQLAANISDVCWDRLLLSAKLSVYKAWFPRANWWENLKSARIVIDAYAGTFIADLLSPGPAVDGSPITEMRGRWLAHREFLMTTIAVPAA
jgi:4'-phosphopantetheinyl transferase EntD